MLFPSALCSESAVWIAAMGCETRDPWSINVQRLMYLNGVHVWTLYELAFKFVDCGFSADVTVSDCIRACIVV